MAGSPLSRSSRQATTLPHLLLVEDDAAFRVALTRTLGHRFEVTAVADGASAALRLETTRYDIVLSDVVLGGMTGIELLRLVRSHDPEMPVILMTGLPNVDGAIEAMDLGALTYIKKPFEQAVLDAALDRAMKRAELARSRSGGQTRGPGAHTSDDRADLASSFERALDSMWIAFQPIFDGRARKTIGFEALMRSDEPTMPSPTAILDAADRLGRIHEVGRRVRERAAAAFEGDRGNTLLFVNLHSADLLDADLLDDRSPLAKIADRVVLEITERAAIGDIAGAQRRTAELRTKGFKIAIDDLGAGYAGLTSFATFEPEIVKIDMSLVRGVEQSQMKRVIVGSIASLCHDLQIRVVAEGIETSAELSCMVELGCEYLQGFLLGRPARRCAPSTYAW